MKILLIANSTGDTKGMYEIKKDFLEQIQVVEKSLEINSVTEKENDLDSKISESNILISNDLSLLTPDNTKNLKWVHLTSAGTNKVPEFIKNSKIIITNSSGVHPIPISEHVFGLMIMLSRGIHKAMRTQVKDKKWRRDYDYFQPQELFGKNILIVGMGRIGERMAEIAKVFGMEVSGVVRSLNKKRKTKVKLYEIKNLAKAVSRVDFIVNCLPGTEQTKGIFNKKIFNEFKTSAFFINIGRGTSVVESDLIEILKTKQIAGAGLDVFEKEPLPESSGLWNLENVIITPHYSGWNPNYTERVITIFIKNLKAYLKKEPLPNLVHKDLGY